MVFLISLLIITILYNTYIINKSKKIPVSLSETAYLFNKRYLFTLYCIIIGIITLPMLFNLINDRHIFLPILFITGLAFAGISSDFKKGTDKIVHYISAFTSFVAFIIFMILYFPCYLIILYIIILIGLCIWKLECYVYFAEILGILILNIWLLEKI